MIDARRIEEAGLNELITAVHAAAHTLPFAAGFFDAIVSIDAYQYFGTADLYLGYVLDFLKLIITKEATLHIDLNDDIVAACLMAQGGEVKRK